jgi:hypothetical protein
VNFERADRQEMRWGLNYSRPVGPQRPPGGFGPGAAPGGGRPEGGPRAGQGADTPRGGSESGFRGGGGRGGGRFGPGGRLQFAVHHTWRFEDTILIRQGVPELDLLEGSAVGARGGRPRHEVDVQAGLFRNGFGGWLNGRWQAGTTVNGRDDDTAGDLTFSDLTTVNLRLFADLDSSARWWSAGPGCAARG